MDITGIQTLEEVIGKLRKRGVVVVLCEANPRVLAKLRTAGVLNSDSSDEGYCATLKEALARAGVAEDSRESLTASAGSTP